MRESASRARTCNVPVSIASRPRPAATKSVLPSAERAAAAGPAPSFADADGTSQPPRRSSGPRDEPGVTGIVAVRRMRGPVATSTSATCPNRGLTA